MDVADAQTETDQDPEAEAGGSTEAARQRVREATAGDNAKGLQKNGLLKNQQAAEIFPRNHDGRHTSYRRF